MTPLRTRSTDAQVTQEVLPFDAVALRRLLRGLAPDSEPGLSPPPDLDAGSDPLEFAGRIVRQTMPENALEVLRGFVAHLVEDPTPTGRPHWVVGAQELWYDGRVVKRLTNPAEVQAVVFAAFEKAGWPPCLQVKPPPGKAGNAKRRHRQTIESLNAGLVRGTIRFYSDRRGGFAWRKDE